MGTDVPWSELPDGFEFGIVETDEELDELVRFNNEIHGPEAGGMLRRLVNHLPDFNRQMNYFIRDVESGKTISAISAIPSVWSYGGIPLRNLELGFVGTRESYRTRGMFAFLYRFFEHQLETGYYDIATIQGIPYFYRKYGYEFILPLGRFITILPSAIPHISTEDVPPYMGIRVRPASSADISALMGLFSEMQSRLLITSARDVRLWQAQELTRMHEDRLVETFVLERNDVIDGYFRINEAKDSDAESVQSIRVSESSIKSYDSVMRTLQFLKSRATDSNASAIEIAGDTTSNLGKIAMDYGGLVNRGWKYQVKIPNVVSFIQKICPVLDKRLKASMFSELTRDVFINTYNNCYQISIEKGNVKHIADIGMQPVDAYTNIRIPPQAFLHLLLGDASIEELHDRQMDFLIRPGEKTLLEILFPKMASYISYYHV